MTIHELTKLVPESSAEDYLQIKDSIAENGQQHPIITDNQDQILDGRTRFKICHELGLEPRVEQYAGTLPIAQYILITNIRRNLTKGQRLQMLADFAPLIIPQIDQEMKKHQLGNLQNSSIPKHDPRPEETFSSRSKPSAGERAVMKATGATLHEAKQIRSIHKHAPELLKEVGKNGLGATAKKARAQKAAPTKKAITKTINTKPIERMKAPTFEETGYPVNGTIEEKMAHGEKYGRTPMFAKDVKDMLNNQAMVSTYVASIMSVTNKTHPNREAFFEAVDAMLAWVPRPEKGPDWKIDFRRKARTQLELLAERLPLAVEQLSKLHETWKQRSLVQSKVVTCSATSQTDTWSASPELASHTDRGEGPA